MTTSGIGGTFDPGQTNWPLGQDPGKYTGPAEQAQKKDTQVGTSKNILMALPEETIPLHLLSGHIGFQESSPEHPVLPRAFERFRDVSGGEIADKAFYIVYQNLLNGLSSNLQDKFNAEMQKPIAERDPDMQALNLTLQFKAGVISLLNSFMREVDEKSPIFKAAESYLSLPEKTDQAAFDFSSIVLGAFEKYAETLGPNHAGYEPLLNVIKEAKEHL